MVLFAVNIFFIPAYGYWACAWGGVAGYGTAMVLSYVVGQRKNPIPYPVKDMALYVALTAMLTISIQCFPSFGLSQGVNLAFNTLCIAIFTAYIVKRDLPLSSLPIIGKKFKK